MQNPFHDSIYTERRYPRKTDIRGDYFRDQTAIIHSTAFRRLKKKTQVFFVPDNDHVCTRIEHVLHVATIAATICKGLNTASSENWNLNTEMAYTIGLGHDLGHTPFGHSGEYALNKLLGNNYSFVHEINSYRQVEFIENNGLGLNLCFGIKDGIICHNGEIDEQYIEPSKILNNLNLIKRCNVLPNSYEACIMRFSDKIAYLGRDIEDALMLKYIKQSEIPPKVVKFLGDRNGKIINTLIIDIIENSKNINKIGFSDEKFELVNSLKEFNYKYIYKHPQLLKYDNYCSTIIKIIYDYLLNILEKNSNDFDKYDKKNIDQQFSNFYADMYNFYAQTNANNKQIISDYISGMTDNFAIEIAKEIYPKLAPMKL